jgi:hypothetical protein
MSLREENERLKAKYAAEIRALLDYQENLETKIETFRSWLIDTRWGVEFIEFSHFETLGKFNGLFPRLGDKIK